MGKICIPTGVLLVNEYSRGKLETLSIGDYGKGKNVKANFLGYDKPINGVPNGDCMPLSEKWVITLSTQYGCPMKCTFCDVPNIPFKGNASFEDLKKQFYNAINAFPNIHYTERLNVHFARMGEPIYNRAVFDFTRWLAYQAKYELQSEGPGLRTEVIHPVLTTSLPRKCAFLQQHINEWCALKRYAFNGQAGLQFSINSTDEEQRNKMFRHMQISLEDLSLIGRNMIMPLGRKYCLNFAYATGSIIDAYKLLKLFSPDKFMVKITPIHNNQACKKNGIETLQGYESYAPYQGIEEQLIKAGFDVLVFIPSMDEENGLVTCGNAILAGSKLNASSPV